jgi:mannose-6-phosphate isomerase
LNIGESWVLSGVSEDESKVASGTFTGRRLSELIHEYKSDLVGEKVYNEFGSTFPLLFKFIDARDDLSVQLHPDDRLAKKRHNSFGKTEMWYILKVEEDARLILGFKKEISEVDYLKNISEGRIIEILHSEKVKKGDSFFIAPGTVHAIGAGVMLAEIQQTSDITYRIYDWDRPGTDGNMRELHNTEALDAIDYSSSHARLNYKDLSNESVRICKSTYFETNKLMLTKDFKRSLLGIDSFIVYMCIEGQAIIETLGYVEEVSMGDTVLIPACASEIQIKSQFAIFLEVYIP